jgi:hypothetical protein
VRRARFVRLGTSDAQGLYAKFGFQDVLEWRRTRSYSATEMVLARDDALAP